MIYPSCTRTLQPSITFLSLYSREKDNKEKQENQNVISLRLQYHWSYRSGVAWSNQCPVTGKEWIMRCSTLNYWKIEKIEAREKNKKKTESIMSS